MLVGFPILDRQGKVVTEDRRRRERRNWTRRPQFPLMDSDGQLIARNRRRVVDRRGLEQDEQPEAAAEGKPAETRTPALTVRHGGEVRELRSGVGSLLIGRRSGCDLRVASRHVSREHARIELRGDDFVLIDLSSNGTFVQSEGGESVDVFRGEHRLTGRGFISLGRPVDEGTEDLIEYTCST
jgi:pSer/pThr/pTyr-binding forkhead associated (FHA) protein